MDNSKWHISQGERGALLYTLEETGERWDNGEPVAVNRMMVKIEGSKRVPSEEIKAFSERLLAKLNAQPKE